MQILNPRNKADLTARNRLLQKTMRPDNSPFAIEEEYPLVLAPESARFSYCLAENNSIVAHANLWPRVLTDFHNKQIKIGLIGNVATDPGWRGRGIMSALFARLAEQAKSQGLQALVLWSDLIQFYQKLGFTSYGNELRFHFNKNSLANLPEATTGQFFPISPTDLSLDDLTNLINRRHAVPASLNRSSKEFKAMLGIPATTLFVLRDNDAVTGYGVVGKGCDLAGVIHEWGAPDPFQLLSGIHTILNLVNLSELILMAPATLNETWRNELEIYCVKVEEHPLALVNFINRERVGGLLRNSFIWGLDSI